MIKAEYCRASSTEPARFSKALLHLKYLIARQEAFMYAAWFATSERNRTNLFGSGFLTSGHVMRTTIDLGLLPGTACLAVGRNLLQTSFIRGVLTRHCEENCPNMTTSIMAAPREFLFDWPSSRLTVLVMVMLPLNWISCSISAQAGC